MIPFTEWIRIENRPTEFNFRKVHAPNHDKFFISMVDSGKNHISFDMVMNTQGKWAIIRPAPETVIQVKEQLIRIIEKHCSLNPVSYFDPNYFNKLTVLN